MDDRLKGEGQGVILQGDLYFLGDGQGAPAVVALRVGEVVDNIAVLPFAPRPGESDIGLDNRVVRRLYRVREADAADRNGHADGAGRCGYAGLHHGFEDSLRDDLYVAWRTAAENDPELIRGDPTDHVAVAHGFVERLAHGDDRAVHAFLAK